MLRGRGPAPRGHEALLRFLRDRAGNLARPAVGWWATHQSVTDIEKLQPAASHTLHRARPYEAWFKKQVLDICGVDANTKPLGPMHDGLDSATLQEEPDREG
jgi:hypothetical protein